ncbi:uncharacterized protein LOC133892135 [Phragmites australis]|uniref:uncharacterized protein LOC133892135 n=1 Tax=Phragmites australis TaxID=29695 RepID=UPI002D773DF7|nr:uncharacterized protein LOC133892135 [Phragmites australis]
MVQAAGGHGKVMANYFPTALTGSAWSWLMNLPRGSVHSWEDLCDQFVANFQGTYTRSWVEDDLYQVRQQQDESLRDYIRCFTERRNTIPRITGESMVIEFKRGVKDQKMVEKLATRVIRNTTELFELVNK